MLNLGHPHELSVGGDERAVCVCVCVKVSNNNYLDLTKLLKLHLLKINGNINTYTCRPKSETSL